MQFLVIFTCYNEGQSFIKNEAFFSQLMMYMSNGRQVVKPFVMSIFRNITFNHNNKQKLIVCDRWLKLLASRTLELNGSADELKNLALIVWYLIANSQRGKSAVRSVSLDTRMQMAAASLPDGHPTLEIVEEVMHILKPSSRDS
uniref:Uncharacterized protein n=1 Tax=Lygus hesperus TaxID=30085 RepID=A0A146LNN4_LYGHE